MDHRCNCQCGLRAAGKHRVETFIQAQAGIAGVFHEPWTGADYLIRRPVAEPLGGAKLGISPPSALRACGKLCITVSMMCI